MDQPQHSVTYTDTIEHQIDLAGQRAGSNRPSDNPLRFWPKAPDMFRDCHQRRMEVST